MTDPVDTSAFEAGRTAYRKDPERLKRFVERHAFWIAFFGILVSATICHALNAPLGVAALIAWALWAELLKPPRWASFIVFMYLLVRTAGAR